MHLDDPHGASCFDFTCTRPHIDPFDPEDNMRVFETPDEQIARLSGEVDRLRTEKLSWKRRALRAEAKAGAR